LTIVPTKIIPIHLIFKVAALCLFIFVNLISVNAQKVGLVLSGGGAAGMTHIGILKALEEHNIPIDYITGTSSGALVGSMYAAGYSPEEIEGMVNSEQFRLMATGGVEDEHKYYFKKPSEDGSWISIKISKDFKWTNSLPTNITNPQLLDFELMSQLSAVSAQVKYNFDSLFVPFRCVASDVESKKVVIFKDGHLNQAVRASMSFPFYLKPIKVNGKLLFDGGLYNNFPTDVMYDEFFPDIIIGCNLSDTITPPDENDLLSQLKAMVVSRDDYSIICENGILIDPKTKVGTFEFETTAQAINDGYDATIAQMELIKSRINRRVNKSHVDSLRKEFNQKSKPIIFDSITIKGINNSQKSYVKKNIFRRKSELTIPQLKKRYFNILSDDKIDFIYPLASINPNGKYTLKLAVHKEQEIVAKFGGNFSSKSINMGHINVKYKHLGKQSITLGANSYFGKFYGSVNAKARIDFALGYPFYIEVEGIINRWDYFKNFATFFEDVRPSFIVQNEKFVGVNIASPIGNTGKLLLNYKYGLKSNTYHQTINFLASDTADITDFDFHTIGLKYEMNSLNRKFWASEGTKLSIGARYIDGWEELTPGNLNLSAIALEQDHYWFQIGLEAQHYFKINSFLRIGADARLQYSSQDLFSNYTSTKLMAPIYEPIPETKSRYLAKYRNLNFASFGAKAIFTVKKNFDLRIENFYYQPYQGIIEGPTGLAETYPDWQGNEWISSASIVYHSPIAPVSFTVNYYSGEIEPWSFVFNLGYLIFNHRAFN
jgi:NTE family protein